MGEILSGWKFHVRNANGLNTNDFQSRRDRDRVLPNRRAPKRTRSPMSANPDESRIGSHRNNFDLRMRRKICFIFLKII